MRWQAKLFDAAVIHVHSTGTADVVYDFDRSVGILDGERAAVHGW